MNMTSVMWKKCLAYTTLCLFTFIVIVKVVEGNVQVQLSVQLQEYYNEYHLKYIPENRTTPYCCCSNGNVCFNSPDTSNLTYESCKVQCSLRFMICADFANIEDMEAENAIPDYPYCYKSVVDSAPSIINFACPPSGVDFFPSQHYQPQFFFLLENYSQVDFNEVKLIVVIENYRQNPVYFEMVDKVYIPIKLNSYSESENYHGTYGIATITLGYMSLIITSEGDSDSIQQVTASTTSQMIVTTNTIKSSTLTKTIMLPGKACLTSAPVEEAMMPPTATFTTTSQAIQSTMSSMDTFVTTVTVTQTVQQTVTLKQAEPSPSMHCESASSSSSSAWMPVSLFLLVVSMALLIVVAIVTIAALYWLRKKKRISDAVPTEEGTNASGTQEVVHNVDNVLYALPSTTSKEMPQVNGSNKEGNEVPLLNIANAVYALPTHSPDQQNSAEHPSNLTPTEAKGEEGKYMELSNAIIAPSDYLCPAKTAT